MAPYQERVIEEKKELDVKIEKLKTFSAVPGDVVYDGLPAEEKHRLARQLALMLALSIVLGERIEAFEENPNA